MATRNHVEASEDAPQPSASHPAGGTLVEYEDFIEDQLRRTRSHVRAVDIVGNLMTLATATLAFFLAAAVVDHWVMPGGLGFWGRSLLCVLLVTSAAVYLALRVLPLFVRRINPLYAAHTIERSRPTLKNALVNFLFFRARPGALPGVVYQAIEEQAARNLAQVRVESAVDRSKLITIGYVLAGVLLVCALYTLLSPKNLLQTAGRIVMPWAELDAPTRTSIGEITPGDTQAFRGQQVTVSARIQGLDDDTLAKLVYSTADGQVVDRAVEMALAADGYQHTAVLPAGDASLQQDLEYRIVAGDAVSKRFHVHVVAAPTIVVRSVAYRYPKYTGLLDQRIEHQGDIRAIEGTEVTIEALANQEIQSAWVDFDCDDTRDLPLLTDNSEGRVSFRLNLKDDRQTPEHASYQLIFKNFDGRQNPEPVRHQLEVTRDLAPEIQIVAPQKDDLELPLDAVTQVELVANDPDFALRLVKLGAAVGQKKILDEVLLNEVRSGQFVRKLTFDPRKLGLKVGDVVDYGALAEDNKDPQPNRTETVPRKIRIVSPLGEQPRHDQVARRERADDVQRRGAQRHDPDRQDAPDESRDEPPRAEHKSQDNHDQPDPERDETGANKAAPRSSSEDDGHENTPEQQGAEGAAPNNGRSGQNGQSAERDQGASNVPNDGSDDGDAFDQILKHQNQREQPKSPASKGRQSPADDRSQGQKKSQEDQQAADDAGRDQQDVGAGNSQSKGEKGSKADRRQEKSEPAGSQGQEQRRPQSEETSSSAQDEQQGGGEQAEGAKQPRSQESPPSNGAQDRSQGPQGGQGAGGGSEGASSGDSSSDGQNGQGAAGKSGSSKKNGGQKQGQGQPGQPRSGQPGKGSPAEQGQSGQADDGQSNGKRQAKKSGSKQSGSERNGKAGDATSGEKSDHPENSRDQNASRQGGSAGQQRAGSRDGHTADETKQGQEQSGEQSKSDQAANPRAKSGREKSTEKNSEKSTQQRKAAKSDPSGKGDDSTTKQPSADNGEKGANEKKSGKRGSEATNGPDKSAPDKNSADQQRKGSDTREQDAQHPAPSERQNQQGHGDQSKGGDGTQPDRNQPSPSPSDKDQANGGDGENEKGDSGAGQSNQQEKGSPNPTQGSQARPKSPSKSNDQSQGKPDNEAQSPSHSQKESNSEGGADGDRSGGGKSGGGQKANKPGTGGDGQNTPADQGAGRSDQPGTGEDSQRAGGDRESERPTGQAGSKPGAGSSSKPASGGAQPGGKDGGAQESGSAASSQPSSGQAPSGTSQSTGPPQGGKPGGAPANQAWKPGIEEAEAANLEYTRKATDLALSSLKDELKKDRPDPELLEKLGWSRDDLEKFVNRWEQMRRQAQAPGQQGVQAKKELDDALKSLGLRPRATSLGGRAVGDDQTRGYKESRRTAPPPEYAEQSKAYSQGTARGEK